MSETYRAGVVLIVADYMANYTCGGVYSMNSVFGHPVFALVMCVSYNREENVVLPNGKKEMQQQKKWFFFMGEKQKDELAADYYHFCMCLQWLLQYCAENGIDVNEMIDTTDNCSLEFKSRRLLVLLLKILKNSSLEHYHHRLCEAHNGKGECDGAGGVLKAAWNDAEFHQKGRLVNALACWKYAHDELREKPDIPEGPRPYNTVTESREYIYTVDKERFDAATEEGDKLREAFDTPEKRESLLLVDYKNEKLDGEKVKDISKYHEFYWNNKMDEGILYARKYHCSCEEDKAHKAFTITQKKRGRGADRTHVLCGEVLNDTECLKCFGKEGNQWIKLEIKELEHESSGARKIHHDLSALWNSDEAERRKTPMIVAVACPEWWNGISYCVVVKKPYLCQKDRADPERRVIEWGYDYLHPEKKFTSNVGEPELHVRFLELWPQQTIINRHRTRKEDDPDMVRERDNNPDRQMNLSRNVFFQPAEGECKIPTRYVVSPTSNTKLNIKATWYTLRVGDEAPLDYLVLSESDMNVVELYIDENS